MQKFFTEFPSVVQFAASNEATNAMCDVDFPSSFSFLLAVTFAFV